MGPARVVAGLAVIGLAVVTLAFPERVLRCVEDSRLENDGVARAGGLVTAFVGVTLSAGP